MTESSTRPKGVSSPGASRRDAYPLIRVIPTRWMDNDVYGHVNNVVYYSYFDTLVNATLIERGLLDPLSGSVIGLVVETGCRYAASISFPEPVEAGMRVTKLGRSSVRYEIGLFTPGREAPAAEGFFVHVYVNNVTRRPVELPEALRAFLETLALQPEE